MLSFVNAGTRTTTIPPPVTLLNLPTVDPNSNAYIVWSVGHGGSGWSYQKHGGKVKWSAQNSEAEGDNWSVEGKDENNQEDSNSQWLPISISDNKYEIRGKTKSNKGKLVSK